MRFRGQPNDASRGEEALPTWLRSAWPSLTILILLAAMLVGLDLNPLGRFERLFTDFLLRAREAAGLSPKPDQRIFMIGLETADFQEAPTTAAEYHLYADLIRMLTDLGANTIALDVIMVRGGPEESQAVLSAIRASKRVVLAEALVAGAPLRSFPFQEPEFSAALVNLSSDPDGVHRRYSYGIAAGRECRPSLALAAYLMSIDAPGEFRCPAEQQIAWKELSADQTRLVERKLSTHPAALNFRSSFTEPWDRGFQYASVRDLKTKYSRWKQAGGKSSPPGSPPRGSVVLVGAVGTGVSDTGATPFSRHEPLIQLHATALNDLMQRRILSDAPPVGNALVAAAALLLFGALSRYIPSTAGVALLCAALIALAVAASGAALIRWEYIVDGFTPAAFLLVALVMESGRRSGLATLERVRLRATLGRYFSPRVLEEVLRRPDAMQPREAEITVLVTDLRNFTTITERSGTKRMFDLLNDIFEVETRAVLELDGSMEHFVGDQFLAYWGAPQPQTDAADRALRAARRIVDELEALKANLEAEVRELFGFGLAIHVGPALVGNKGSRMRLDYGILGDMVNATARLESLTKLYGVRQIVTRGVLDAASQRPDVRFLDRIRVKGRAAPVEMYEVVHHGATGRQSLHHRYEDAWRIYAEGRFEEALAQFQALVPEDAPSRVLATRCRELVAKRPPEWDGAYQMSEK